MSASNGVIRVGRKGRKKFAFGEDGEPFEVDVVVAWQQWIDTDRAFRDRSEDRTINDGDMVDYHRAAVEFVCGLAVNTVKGEYDATATPITTAEALDFIARLREQYDEVASFFQPKSREEPDSPGSSAAELRFSAEPAN